MTELDDTTTNLTPDEQEWAREQGATTPEEMVDLVAKHEAWQQGLET